jgi:hypothetical protein
VQRPPGTRCTLALTTAAEGPHTLLPRIEARTGSHRHSEGQQRPGVEPKPRARSCRIDDSRCQVNWCSAAEDPLLLDVLYVRRTASVGVTGDGHPLAAS